MFLCGIAQAPVAKDEEAAIAMTQNSTPETHVADPEDEASTEQNPWTAPAEDQNASSANEGKQFEVHGMHFSIRNLQPHR